MLVIDAAVAIPAGTTIESGHVALRRPAAGLPPSELERVVGATASADIERDAPLTADNVKL